MRSFRLSVPPLGIASLILVAALTLLGQDIIEGIAAVVGDRVVLKSDVAQLVQMRAMELRLPPDTDSRRIMKLQDEVLETLIQQKLILEIAEVESIVVQQREVDTALDQYVASLINQAGSEEAVQNAFGKSLRDLKREWWPDMQEQLIAQKFQQHLARNVAVTRQEVVAFHEQYRDSLGVIPTLYRVSHILLKVTPGTASRQKARHLADSLRTRLVQGDDFARIAADYSDDPGTAKHGGELGVIRRGVLVPEFEAVAFDLRRGEISGVVETPFGYHVIQMIERVGEKINVRHVLVSPHASDADEDSVYALALGLTDSIQSAQDMALMAGRYSQDENTRQQGGSLGWVDPARLPWPTVGDVLTLLDPEHVSRPVRSSDGYHLVFIHQLKPGGRPSLTTHWAQIEALALQRKTVQLFQDWFQKAASRIFIRNYIE